METLTEITGKGVVLLHLKGGGEVETPPIPSLPQPSRMLWKANLISVLSFYFSTKTRFLNLHTLSHIQGHQKFRTPMGYGYEEKWNNNVTLQTNYNINSIIKKI